MADSVGFPQPHGKCQFCEESEEVKWLCYSCNLKLCELCNSRIHSKIEAIENHNVIATCMEDINSEAAIDIKNLKCEVHGDQKCTSFCLDCYVTLCQTCHEVHKDHDKKELLILYDEILAEIQEVTHDIGESLLLVDMDKAKLTRIGEDKSNEYKKVKVDIDKREADVIAEVKKYSQKLHNEVDQVYQPILAEIQTNLSEVQQVKVQLKEKKDIIENILQSHQPKDVLYSSKTIGDIPVPQQSGDIPNTTCLLTPGDSLDSKLGHIFGEVMNILEIKLVKTYKTELTIVTDINWHENEKVISSYYSNKLQRVRFDNDAMTVIKEEGIYVYDMAVMENGDALISSVDNELMTYKQDGTLTPYKSFQPLYTLGVHINRHNEVLIGLKEPGSITITPDSIRKVVVLDQSGDIHHTYQYTRDKQRLFTWPSRIITCQDTICVVDELNGAGEGRVVALNYGGHVQWVYNGAGIEGQNEFYPQGMAITPTDLILVADSENKAIHALNPRGQVIVCHQMKGLAVEGPFSLCVDNEGLLWMGCTNWEDGKGKILSMTLT